MSAFVIKIDSHTEYIREYRRFTQLSDPALPFAHQALSLGGTLPLYQHPNRRLYSGFSSVIRKCCHWDRILWTRVQARAINWTNFS